MKTYLRILSYSRPYTGRIILYTLFTAIMVLFTGLTFAMLQPLLQQLFHPGGAAVNNTSIPGVNFNVFNIHAFLGWVSLKASSISAQYGKSNALLFVTVLIVSLNLLSNIFRYLSSRVLGTIRTRVVEDLRESAFQKLVKLHIGHIEGARKGDIITRVTSDVTEVENSVVVTFESLIRDPISIIYYLYLMFAFSWKLTIFIFIILPVSAALITRITKSLRRDAVETQRTYGLIMSVVDETISGIRIIKAFTAEKYIKHIFDRFNKLYSRLTRQQWHKKALIPIFSESAMILVVGIVMWYGGNLVYSGEIADASGFITYLGYFFIISRPAKSLSQSFNNIHKGIASAERIFELMDIPAAVTDKPGAVSKKDFNTVISIRNLSFSYYSGGPEVLKNINLEIEKGKVIALVGPSGSGKTTLAELILRFYDAPLQSEVLLDGIDIRDIRSADLRSLMAVVTQEPILFNDSVFNNIAFGMAGVKEEDVIAAAKAANAHDFIMQMEKDYRTSIGDRGGLLSGGQRQRLSIARAILKNPPILILDEATSALDSSSEKIVQDALYKLMANRTSIVIAHRLSTVIDADEIIVLEKGEIAERGTHRQLITMDGLYRSLYQLQQAEV